MNEVKPIESSATEIQALVEAQRAYFQSGATLPKEARESALRALSASIRRHEGEIKEALYADLHKPEYETYGTETSLVLNDAKHALRHLHQWMRPKKWMSPMVAQPAQSRLLAQPLGTNLILGAWNYPIQLTLQPLVPALAAGNVAVIKPSELSPQSSAVVAKIVAEALPREHVAVVEGGVPTSGLLLEQAWDHVFYTGGTRVGRIVAQAAAKHLSRVTLELGGKSPCVVMPSANLDTAVSRIGWGRYMNAGQSCVAPDYVLVHRSVKDAFLAKLKARLIAFYGADPQASPDFARIVNVAHTDRIARLIDPAKVVHGGQVDRDDRYVAPTIMADVSPSDPVMQDEIFGPVLPVITIDDLSEAYGIIRQHPNPLAAYIFTESTPEGEAFFENVSCGGGCVNNTMYHVSDPAIPFGGVGTSGLGAYHGKHGFERFSHFKGILWSQSHKLFDPGFKYPPYEGNLRTLKFVVG